MALALLLPGCETSAPQQGTAQLDRAVQRAGIIADSTGPRRLSPAATFRVSPAWSPSGRWLAVAGQRGVGLYLLPVDGGAERVVDVDHRGPWRWRRDANRDVLCFGQGATAEALDAETWEVLQPCAPMDYDAERGDFIGAAGDRRFYANSRLGTVSVVRDGRTRTIPLDQGAWGAKVSPDGRYVAYCTGTLAKAELLLLDVAAGRTRLVGPGAQAAWTPDGKRFVYTRIGRLERIGRAAVVTAARMYLYDVASRRSRALDTAAEQAATQPTLSPDGRSLAYADWRSGGIFVRPAPAWGTP